MTTHIIKLFAGLLLILGLASTASAASVSSFDAQFQIAQSEAPAGDGETEKKPAEEEPDC